MVSREELNDFHLKYATNSNLFFCFRRDLFIGNLYTSATDYYYNSDCHSHQHRCPGSYCMEKVGVCFSANEK